MSKNTYSAINVQKWVFWTSSFKIEKNISKYIIAILGFTSTRKTHNSQRLHSMEGNYTDSTAHLEMMRALCITGHAPRPMPIHPPTTVSAPAFAPVPASAGKSAGCICVYGKGGVLNINPHCIAKTHRSSGSPPCVCRNGDPSACHAKKHSVPCY